MKKENQCQVDNQQSINYYPNNMFYFVKDKYNFLLEYFKLIMFLKLTIINKLLKVSIC